MRIIKHCQPWGADKYDGYPFWVYTYEYWMTPEEVKEWKDKADRYATKYKDEFPDSAKNIEKLKNDIKEHFTLGNHENNLMEDLGYENGISIIDIMLNQQKKKDRK